MKNNPFKLIRPFMVKHEPEILMGMGISGLIFSIVWTVRATLKTKEEIDAYKNAKNIDKLTKKEAFKITAKYFWPVAVSTITSIPLIVIGNRVSNKRYAALAAAYTISETALLEYQEKTREVLGEKKAREIQESIDADRVKKSYSGANQVIITGNGDSLFYEPLTGRYFRSNWNEIAKAANELNSEALGSMSGQITLNEWCDRLGLEGTDIGDEMGWELNGNPGNLIDVEISSHIVPKDNIPCGAISYRRPATKLKNTLY